jgi:integrase
MQERYETIKRARALLAATPKSTARKSTADDYAAKVRRLAERAKGAGTFDALIAEALKTTKKASWQASRAALIFAARNVLDKYVSEQDQVQRSIKAKEAMGQTADWSAWTKLVQRMEHARVALQAVLDAKLPLEGRSDRHTKRQDMRGLPDDWRERIIERMPAYAPATLTAAVTGCRPAELLSGVQLSIVDGGLVARIKGAKVDVEKGKGQEWRKLYWPLDHENGLVRELISRVQEAGGSLLVTVANASNFSKSMSNAAKREWPKRKAAITPYCFRHQCAADMKASDMSSGDISAALGHLSDVTKSTYGHANMGRSGGVAPAKVESALKVKTKEPSTKAKKRSASIKNTNQIRLAP